MKRLESFYWYTYCLLQNVVEPFWSKRCDPKFNTTRENIRKRFLGCGEDDSTGEETDCSNDSSAEAFDSVDERNIDSNVDDDYDSIGTLSDLEPWELLHDEEVALGVDRVHAVSTSEEEEDSGVDEDGCDDDGVESAAVEVDVVTSSSEGSNAEEEEFGGLDNVGGAPRAAPISASALRRGMGDVPPVCVSAMARACDAHDRDHQSEGRMWEDHDRDQPVGCVRAQGVSHAADRHGSAGALRRGFGDPRVVDRAGRDGRAADAGLAAAGRGQGRLARHPRARPGSQPDAAGGTGSEPGWAG